MRWAVVAPHNWRCRERSTKLTAAPPRQLAALATPVAIAAALRHRRPSTLASTKASPSSWSPLAVAPWAVAHAAAALGARAAARAAPPPAAAAAVGAYVVLTAVIMATAAAPSTWRGGAAAAAAAATAVATFEAATPTASRALLPLIAWAAFTAALLAASRSGPAASVAAKVAGVPTPPHQTLATAPARGNAPPPLAAAALAHSPGRRASADHDLPPLAPPAGPASTSMLPGSYADPGAAGFKVRGRTYAVDRVKTLAATPRGTLARVEIVSTPAPVPHVASVHPALCATDAPFSFVWHVLVSGRVCVSLICVWAFDEDPIGKVSAALAAARARGETGVPRLADVLAPPPGVATASRDDGAAAVAAAVDRSAASASAAVDGVGPAGAPAHGHRRAATAAGADAAALAAAVGSPAPPPHAEGTGARFPGLDPFDVALARFVAAGGAQCGAAAQTPGVRARHASFKVVPRVDTGPWVVKSAVGQNTPVLLGRKVDTSYYVGEWEGEEGEGRGVVATAGGDAPATTTPTTTPRRRYIEVDVDVGSSRTAARVVGMVQGALRSLDITIAVLLEGRSSDELPEALLGTVHLSRVDLDRAPRVG